MLLISLLFACATETPNEPVVSQGIDVPVTNDAANAGAPEKKAEWEHFGAPFSVDEAKVVKAAALFAAPDTFVGKTVRVEARVADVCQKAGCWMVITDPDSSESETMRILMKDHAFAVDKQGAGRSCQVEGVVVSKAVDPETVAHFEGESARPELIPEKEKTVTYQLVASTVAMN